MSDSPSLDPAAIQRLLRLGGSPFVCKMIDLFLDYTAKKIAEARAAHTAGDAGGVERAVHPVKSSAGNVGAGGVQELALRLETLAREGRFEDLAAPLAELEQAFASVKPELEEKKRSLSANAP